MGGYHCTYLSLAGLPDHRISGSTTKEQLEVDAILTDNPIPTNISSTEKLIYTEAVVHETMRLKSVAPLFFIKPNMGVEIAGFPIPKGTFLMLVNRYGLL